MKAIVKIGANQHIVSKGDVLEINRLDINEGQSWDINDVLTTFKDGSIKVGKPTVSGAKVVAEVKEHFLGPKVTIFKFKRRRNYQRKTGHRQRLTKIEIIKVEG